VEDGAVCGDYQVDAGGEQLARLAFEDGGTEGPSGPVAEVETGELDREPHSILDGRVDAVRQRILLNPVRETQHNPWEPHDRAPLTRVYDSRAPASTGEMLELETSLCLQF
jgi:hypothetical protein